MTNQNKMELFAKIVNREEIQININAFSKAELERIREMLLLAGYALVKEDKEKWQTWSAGNG